MRLSLETRYNVYDDVEYKKIDTFAIFENGEPKEEIKRGEISFVEIQVGQEGHVSVKYGIDNEDMVCSDCIIKCLNE